MGRMLYREYRGIVGLCVRVARRFGYAEDRIESFMNRAIDGEFGHLSRTFVILFSQS